MTILEGTTATFTVKLNSQPSANVNVRYSSTGNSLGNIAAAPIRLTFTPSNYSTAQTVTLSSSQDDDRYDGSLTITQTASNGGYNGVTATLAVTEDDDDNNGTLTASDATARTVYLALSGYSGEYWHQRAGWNECWGPVSAPSFTLTGLQPNSSSYVNVYHTSVCAAKDIITKSNRFQTLNPTLTASNITDTSVRLTLSDWDLDNDGTWYYGKTNVWCSGPVSQLYSDKSDLTGNTQYSYAVYGDASCSAELVSPITFTTPQTPVSVSNLTIGSDGDISYVGRRHGNTYWWATSFTTGSSTSGYTLKSVIARFDGTWPGGQNFTAKIYSDNGSALPASSRATLSGNAPTSSGDHTYTCTASNSNNCDLSKDTTYHVVFYMGNTSGCTINCYHQWKTTTSGDQTNTPAGSGWTIGDTSSSSSNGTSWSKVTGKSGRITVNAGIK